MKAVLKDSQLLEQLSPYIEKLYKLATETDIHLFRQKAFFILQGVFSCSSGVWFARSDNVSYHKKFTDDTYVFNQPQVFMRNYIELLASLTEPEPIYLHVSQHSGIPIILHEVIPISEWYKTTFYKNHWIRFNIEHVMSCGSLTSNNQFSHLISVYRKEKDQPFSQTDKHYFQLLFPHLLEAFRINILQSFNRSYDGTSVGKVTESNAYPFD